MTPTSSQNQQLKQDGRNEYSRIVLVDVFRGGGWCVCWFSVGCVQMNEQPEMVECPLCGDIVTDFTPGAECIGWLGHCAKCELNGIPLDE